MRVLLGVTLPVLVLVDVALLVAVWLLVGDRVGVHDEVGVLVGDPLEVTVPVRVGDNPLDELDV